MQIFFDHLLQRKMYISNKQIFCQKTPSRLQNHLPEETMPVIFARFLSRVTDFI